MKRRVLVAACALSLALPSLLADTGVGPSPLSGSVAFAQPAASDPITEAARAKYQEGVKAFEAGKFEDARSAFLQAYALKRVPAVLLNLGQSEIKAGHYEDGGNHLQQFIRDHKTAKPDEITAAQNGITEAKKKTGYIILIVNAVGADLSIDGTSIGKSPLLDPYFVKPGKRTIYASFQGSAATTAIDVKKGVASSATLTLNVSSPGPTVTAPPTATAPPVYTAPTATAPPVYTAPTGTAPVYTAPTPTYPYPTTTGPFVTPPANDPLAPPSATGPFPEQPTGAREPLFQWFKRKPVAWIGVGATGIGLILGISFSAAAGAAGATPRDYVSQIEAQKAKDGLGANVKPCGAEDNPNDDLQSPTNYHPACEVLRQSLADYRSQSSTLIPLAGTFWALFGVGAIGTVAYALIDWYPKKGGSGLGPRVTAVAPMLSPAEAGLGVMGEF
jgi:hypothetical protein